MDAPPRRSSARTTAPTVAIVAAAVVAAGVLAVVLAACGRLGSTTAVSGRGAGPTEPVTVRLGYFPNITHAPALVGLRQGFFADALGANRLETTTFNAGSDAVTALFGDGVDIAYLGPSPSINAYQRSGGEAVRIVAGSTSGGAALIVQPDVDDANDLRGRTVASPQLGNTQDVALRSWLRQQGLTTDTAGGGDVTVAPQQNAETLTAFKRGDIAGAWVPEPWASRLRIEGGGKVLVDERSRWPDGRFVTSNVVVATRFLDAHPDVVERFLAGHLRSIAFIAAQPDDARRLASAEIEAVTGKSLRDDVVRAAWAQLEFTSDPLASTLARNAHDAEAVGLLRNADLDGIYDLTLLDGVRRRQGEPPVRGLR